MKSSPLVLILFFASGACGLLYEVVWTRLMTHVFGTTAVAVGTVLAAFMAGLALGGWWIGRHADQSRNPLRLYALLELAIGATALGAHFLLVRIEPAYLAVYELFGRSDAALGAARFALAFGLVLVPTVLMGATLPVLTRFFVERLAVVGARLSALYALNTLGAVTGAALAGFVLIGRLGLDRTVYLAVLGNVVIGAVAWLVSKGRAAQPAASAAADAAPLPEPERAGPGAGRGLYRLVLAGLAVSGFTSFAYEIYWTRSLVFLLGNSTYAVTTMLTAFLAGLALGGFLIRFLMDRVRDRVALFGWLQLLIGLLALLALPALFAVAGPDAVRGFVGGSGRTGGVVLPRLLVSLLVMLPPATLIGATFPLVGRIGVVDLRRTGADVGRIYAVNTLGNVAGALLPGLVLLHLFGVQRGIVVMAALNACTGLVVLSARIGRAGALRWTVPLFCAGAVLLLSRVPLERPFPTEVQGPWHRVLYYEEGPSATTTVLLDPDTRVLSMSVDGVDIGGTGFTDFKQQLLAHLPKLLLDDVSPELSIGLGSGILAGESARHRRVQSLTCVEIEPTVVRGAAAFVASNHGVLGDPRLRVVVDDVSTHLHTTEDRYRVVSADEKTAHEFASNGFSYSREYYALLLRRLAPGGLVAQWVPTTLPPSQYAMILRTFSGVFPHVQLWYFAPAHQSGTANTILVGSDAPLEPDLARMRRHAAAEASAFASFARYGLGQPEAVLPQLIAEGEAVRAAVRDAPENTLNHPRYEFYSPMDYAVPRRARLAENVGLLLRLRAGYAAARRESARAVGEGRLVQAYDAEEEFLAGYARSLAGAPWREVAQHYGAALALAAWNDSLRARVFVEYWSAATATFHRDLREGAELMGQALALYEGSAQAHVEHALVLRRIGRGAEALDAASKAVARDPELVAARRVLAQLLLAAGRREEAAEQLRALLRVEPGDPEARRLLAAP